MILRATKPLKRGDDGADVVSLFRYLELAGYFPSSRLAEFFGKRYAPPTTLPARPDLYDESMVDAVKLFQHTHGLDESGDVDGDTLELMRTPRCNFPDFFRDGVHARFLAECAWPRHDLQWHVIETLPQIGDQAHRQVFPNQLKKWAKVAGLQVSEGPRGSEIQSFTYRGDGGGGTFAYAYYPCSGAIAGDVHFDYYDAWSIEATTPSNKVDFVSVALHEIGHALGLGHEPGVREAVMYPFFSFGEQRRQLSQDDINGIRALYGGGNAGKKGNGIAPKAGGAKAAGSGKAPKKTKNK